MAPGDALSRFSAWLLRPHMDLGPFHAGPLHCRAVEECWASFSDALRPDFVPQRALPRGFRVQLANETSDAYAITDPRQLSRRLRTERWTQLCAAIEGWRELGCESRRRLAVLLHALSFYETLRRLVCGLEETEPEGELAYWRASAEYMLGAPESISDYADADLRPFEHMARHANGRTRFDAAAMVFVHRAKTGGATAELLRWQACLEEALNAACRGVDDFAAGLYRSRFFRASGFLPQRLGDREGLRHTMDEAERYAVGLRPATSAEEHLYFENLHALMESRTKEALWLGDLDLALARARRAIAADPNDSKVWVELGQVFMRRKEWQTAAGAYATAAMLGAPAGAIGRQMAGVCLCRSGDESIAALLFKDTAEIDPFGASPLVAIDKLPQDPAFEALKAWSRDSVRL